MLAGVAVTFVMFMTTMIMTVAILVVWGHNVVLAVAFFLIFGLIDASFLTAALSKFTHGGWFPIALSGNNMLFAIYCVLSACMEGADAMQTIPVRLLQAGCTHPSSGLQDADTSLGYLVQVQIILCGLQQAHCKLLLSAVMCAQRFCSP